MRLVGELDKRRDRGGDHKSEKSKVSREAFDPAGKSAETTADLIGTSRQKVEKARAVLDKAAPEVKAAVVSGDMTINKAYQETRTKASGKIKTPAQEEAFYEKRAKEAPRHGGLTVDLLIPADSFPTAGGGVDKVLTESPRKQAETRVLKDGGERRETGGKTLKRGKKPNKTGVFIWSQQSGSNR